MKRAVYLFDFTRDRRASPGLRDTARMYKTDSMEVVGATSFGRRIVYIDLPAVYRVARHLHYSLTKMLIDTFDHEYAHAFEPCGAALDLEERLAERFERAGRWARRTK